jgi:NAD(P)-dependent dehydrogenase (short-subunit alcohol dehydrogenase family)
VILVFERQDSGLTDALRALGETVERADGNPVGADRLVTVVPPVELEPLFQLEPDVWLERFRSWVEEPFLVFQAWLRDVLAREASGRWVAVTSHVGVRPFPGAGASGAFAAALNTLVKVAGLEYGGRGIRANAVAVGWREDAVPDEVDQRLATSDTPAGRLARSDDVADAIAWLFSPAASHVNGDIIHLDGGYTIARGSRATPSASAAEWLLEERWRTVPD